MLELLNKLSAKMGAPDLVMRERPALVADNASLAPSPDRSTALSEYAAVSQAIGFAHPHIAADLIIEEFKAFLRKKEWAIFSLPTVVAYMDKKAAEESAAKAGWQWRPLRKQDNLTKARFGSRARHIHGQDIYPASDYYDGAGREEHEHEDYYNRGGFIAWSNGDSEHVVKRPKIPSSDPYDKLVPLHALRKVQQIEAEFTKEEHVSFFVSDYAPAPHIEYPDPFLMAVINNGRLAKGVGRFVIDFWDEPGFGLEQQLA